MAAKTPDTTSARIVLGSWSLTVLDFSSTNLDNADTIDVSPYVSVCDAVLFQADADFANAPGLARSGTGNTTITVATSTANLTGQLFVLGTP